MGNTVVAFGEIMLRLSTPGFLRFEQTDSFEVLFGGAEANVAASLARFGVPVEYVTRLPTNEIAEACLAYLRRQGVGVRWVLRGGERVGIYFVETGAVHRGGKVVYDRSGSSAATMERGMVDWQAVFQDADWFHVTGITPAISRGAAEACVEAVSVAREKGLTVSCDLNYRAKLWKWGRPPREVMAELVANCDLVIANEEDADMVFGISAPGTDVTAGLVDAAKYGEVCRQLVDRFPNLKRVAITLRGSRSASHNSWSGVLYQEGRLYSTRTYEITHIVDRIGGGDAFAAGLIYGLRSHGDPQRALDFAVAAGCLKHTIVGDFNLVTLDEVEKLAGGTVSGRISR